MWRVGPARMQHGKQGHLAEPREPTWSSGGTRWRGRVAGDTRVHADTREGRHVASEGLACEGPMG